MTKNNDNQKSYFNNGTEEATTMGAETEAISVEISGLQKHAESFHAKEAVVAKRTEEVENVPAEKATDTKNSEQLVTGTVSEKETAIKDDWNHERNAC